jgi:hypothetical protein
VVPVEALGVVDPRELEQHAQEVGLPAEQLAADDPRHAQGRAPAHELPVDHGLRPHELLVELAQRELRRRDRVLDVVEAVVGRRQLVVVGVEQLRARIGRGHRQMHDLGNRDRPLPGVAELPLVPAGVRDEVDGDVDAEPAGDPQRLEVLVRRRPLAEEVQLLAVERLEAEEHVLQAEVRPPPEHFAVADEHVAAGLQVVAFPDAPALDLVGDGHAVLGVDERHVVDDEEVRLPDPLHLVDDDLRVRLVVAAGVKRPRAAEGAVPRAAARELDRGARVEVADEVAPPAAGQVAGRAGAVEVADQNGLGPGAARRGHAGQAVHGRGGLQQAGGDRLALPGHDAVDGAVGVGQDLVGDERDAVAAGEDERGRPAVTDGPGEVDHLRHVGQVVQREADRVGPERRHLAPQVAVAVDLQVQQAHLVSGAAQGRRHALQPDRLEAQIHLRVQQRAGMDEQDLHFHPCPWSPRWGHHGPIRSAVQGRRGRSSRRRRGGRGPYGAFSAR